MKNLDIVDYTQVSTHSKTSLNSITYKSTHGGFTLRNKVKLV